jgi:hypothetical protein
MMYQRASFGEMPAHPPARIHTLLGLDDYRLRAEVDASRITRCGFLPERSRPQFQHSEN